MEERELARQKAMEFLQRLAADEQYQESLMRRAREGTLAPEIEELVLHYALNPPRAVAPARAAERSVTQFRILETPKAHDDQPDHEAH